MSKKLIGDVVLIGADPEVFIFDSSRKAFTSSIGLIGGTKDDPRPLEDGISVQEDNVLAEFNITPAKTKLEFIKNIQSGLFQLGRILPPSLEIKIATSTFMPSEELLHPKAIEFGCTPDFNAWIDGEMNDKPLTPDDGLRTSGGHAHIGFEPTEFAAELGISKGELAMQIVKFSDLYLGVPSIIMDRDLYRRRLYGKAGCFRMKEYGVEYRTLSSFWLKDVDHIDWAYSQVMRAVESVSTGVVLDKKLGKRIQNIINKSDFADAQALVKEQDLVVIS